MSLDLKSIHVRLDHDVHVRLAALADSNDKDIAEMARIGITEWLMGRQHALAQAATQLVRAGLIGSDGK